jgi:hypothetical protein
MKIRLKEKRGGLTDTHKVSGTMHFTQSMSLLAIPATFEDSRLLSSSVTDASFQRSLLLPRIHTCRPLSYRVACVI